MEIHCTKVRREDIIHNVKRGVGEFQYRMSSWGPSLKLYFLDSLD